jgi:hypothetical protein
LQFSIEKKKKKKSMGLNLRFSNLTSTATPFEHVNFSRNGNKRSSIKSKNKGIISTPPISTLAFGVLMKKKNNSSDLFKIP